MTGLVTCGVCGLVETGAAAGTIGPRCPRCGSRALDFIELPDRKGPVVTFVPPFAYIVGPGHSLADVILHGRLLNPPSPLGGTHVPMTRAA